VGYHHPISQLLCGIVDISFKDDVTVILLIGVSFMINDEVPSVRNKNATTERTSQFVHGSIKKVYTTWG
jgi:hypothetical protein